MKPERWARIQEIFEAAVELPEHALASYLSEACADDADLRLAVERLIGGHRRAADRLSGVVHAAATTEAHYRSAYEPGARIGPFRVLHRIGEGGMGVVLLAEQVEGVQRRVALKLIRPGIDTREVLARFDRERQALARIDHEGIARIYDAGATDEGLPYFAMEFLPDPSITRFCDEARLGTRARLELFEEVCRTVQYAHQKSVIHRDLKPSNILVTQRDGRPATKVIDFGIAKALDAETTNDAPVTRVGQWIGTPEYMSPEQAGASPFDIDTRTDVYSLGVVLYELLVGALPFDISGVGDGGLDELRRILRDVETPRPSTRVSTTSGGGEAVARQRSTDLPTLLKELRGDLDWIVLKALEKDRDTRYQSANELASDIRRFLTHHTVAATPQRTAYRIRKFARRNRALIGAAALLLVALITGLGATAMLARRATAARSLADARYADLLRLSDLKRLADARAAADSLYPAYPEKAPQMERWLRDDANPLRERLALHRAALDSLRELSLPDSAAIGSLDPDPLRSDEVRRLQRDTMVFRRVVDDRRSAGADGTVLAELRAKADSSTARLDTLHAPGRKRTAWTFAESPRQWQHTVLTGLIADLERFLDPDPDVGTVAAVERRLEQARTLERMAADSAVDDAWANAIRDIQSSAIYKGLTLSRQAGLVPLGRDPQSGLWEFWHILSGERPRPAASSSSHSRWQISDNTGMVFVLIPGGEFLMGAQSRNPSAPNYHPAAQDHEGPTHRVSLAPFFLSKYEMTQGQWLRATGTNPSASNPVQPARPGHFTLAHPVEQISYNLVSRVLPRLGLALPTEAQWEFAARGGTSSAWPWGNTAASLRGNANIADRTFRDSNAIPGRPATLSLDDGFVFHAPVGSFRPNRFGLHDVIGNIVEWCRDRAGPYRPGAYTELLMQRMQSLSILGEDGERRVFGGEDRILRGSGSTHAAENARVTFREWTGVAAAYEYNGVRPSRRIEHAR